MASSNLLLSQDPTCREQSAKSRTTGMQGRSNVTNDCINISLDYAQRYVESAMYGDPVEVTGTAIALSYADGDIWDWAVD